MNKISFDEYFLEMASLISKRSPDEETKVGCVIVSEDNRIISTGYNGFPKGFPDDKLPKTRPEKYLYMIHAEANALMYAKTNLNNCTLYCSLSPCSTCFKLILASGISKVVFKEKYSDYESLYQLYCYCDKRKIELFHFNNGNKEKIYCFFKKDKS